MSETKTEQKAAHTPGPWVNDPNAWGDIDAASGEQIAMIIDQSDFGRIVHMLSFEGATAPTEEQARANARLIAAAPALLEALEDAAAILGNVLLRHGGNMSASDLATRMVKLDEFEAAIASARGEG